MDPHLCWSELECDPSIDVFFDTPFADYIGMRGMEESGPVSIVVPGSGKDLQQKQHFGQHKSKT